MDYSGVTVQSDVDGNLYVVHFVLGQDKEAIKKHAELSGFPATHIEEIKTQISPITAS